MHASTRSLIPKRPTITRRAALALLLLSSACAPDLSGDDGGDDGPPVRVESGDAGAITVTFDARDYERWLYLDLESAAQVTPATPSASAEWDLAVLRFNVKTNGGSSGEGGVGVARLPGADWDTLTRAPLDGYISDDADPALVDMEPEPGYAFDLWYDYDMDTHTLNPADLLFVVRTVEGNFFKVQMLDYYNSAGTGGYVKLRAAPIDAP
jgi:hypothetical protein